MIFGFKPKCTLINPATAGFFVAACLLASCQWNYQRISTKPIVQVNEHQLSAKEFSSQLARRLKNLDALAAKDPSNVRTAKEEIVRQFVVESLTLDFAKANKISIDDSDLDKEVNRYRSNYPDDLAFRRSLAQENISFSDWREQLRYTLSERAVFKKLGEKIKPPSEEDIKSYYDQAKDSFKHREKIFMRQILVDEESKAELMKTELKSKDFADLAKKFSIAPEARDGGLVGWIEKGSVDFFDSAFAQPVGAVGPIIKSPFGFHIIKVEKKIPASTLSLEQVRDKIIRNLRAKKEQAEFVAWLDGQLRSSKVMKDQELMNSITVDTRSGND